MNTKLVAYRKMLQMNQKSIAEKIGISLVSYSNKETGKTEFTQNEMITITNIIKEKIPNITMDDIFFDNRVSILVTGTA
ncbi:TPA: helix-turn-helix domain-containing protein [Clostridium botulinum]|nr:helix-turn-helix domain-containing protein [Clostridium botulinum]